MLSTNKAQEKSDFDYWYIINNFIRVTAHLVNTCVSVSGIEIIDIYYFYGLGPPAAE